jgi:hypothetical protein
MPNPPVDQVPGDREALTELCEALEATRLNIPRMGKTRLGKAWHSARTVLAAPQRGANRPDLDDWANALEDANHRWITEREKRKRAEDMLVKIIDRHHRCLTASNLHDPEHQDWPAYLRTSAAEGRPSQRNKSTRGP